MGLQAEKRATGFRFLISSVRLRWRHLMAVRGSNFAYRFPLPFLQRSRRAWAPRPKASAFDRSRGVGGWKKADGRGDRTRWKGRCHHRSNRRWKPIPTDGRGDRRGGASCSLSPFDVLYPLRRWASFDADDLAGREQTLHCSLAGGDGSARGLWIVRELRGRTAATGAGSYRAPLGNPLVEQSQKKVIDHLLGRGAVW